MGDHRSVSLLREVRWLAEPALYVGLVRERRVEGDGDAELAMFQLGIDGSADGDW
jgi:hypothetical protein